MGTCGLRANAKCRLCVLQTLHNAVQICKHKKYVGFILNLWCRPAGYSHCEPMQSAGPMNFSVKGIYITVHSIFICIL